MGKKRKGREWEKTKMNKRRQKKKEGLVYS